MKTYRIKPIKWEITSGPKGAEMHEYYCTLIGYMWAVKQVDGTFISYYRGSKKEFNSLEEAKQYLENYREEWILHELIEVE